MSDKQIYIFDWDDNIVHMPTTIRMEQKLANSWHTVEVNTDLYAKIRNNPDYRYPTDTDNPYHNFSDNTMFLNDLGRALDNEAYGPSFDKFKECLINGSDFAIITARGQSREVIRAGITMIIGRCLTSEEMTTMVHNTDGMNRYLMRQMIYPVNSDELNFDFFKYVGINDSVEMRKVFILNEYISNRYRDIKDIEIDGKVSIGFSDDDKRNVNSIKDFIEKSLMPQYPEIQFTVFDTSDKDKAIKHKLTK